jgi:protein-tyrosine phosphatase
MQLREVLLPAGARGRLFLHGMPGRREKLQDLWDGLGRLGVGVILNLTSEAETRLRSPEYAEAIAHGRVPCDVWRLPMANDGAPDHDAEFERLLRRVADGLRHGTAYLVHCNAGIGRTGTVAAGVLMLLGVPLVEALQTVQAAGSGPISIDQRNVLTRLASRLTPPRGGPLV